MTASQTRSQACLKDFKIKTKAYDVAEKKLIGEFESMLEAAEFFGIGVGSVKNCVANKGRCHKNNLNKTITFR